MSLEAGPGAPTLIERAFQDAACGLVVARFDGTILRANAAAVGLVSPAAAADGGVRRLDDWFPVPAGSPGLAVTLARAAARGITSLELPVADGTGRDRVLNWLIGGASGLLVLAVADVTSRRALGDQLAHLAYHDPLTGLPNRTLLLQRLDHALRRRERAGSEVALLFLDLDRFKEINDVYGHDAGDQLLVGLAGRLEAVVRPADTVGRLSGDEFVVVCEDVEDLDAAMQVVERMEAAVSEPFLLDGVPTRVTASIGCTMTEAGVDLVDAAELLRRADRSMYEVKRSRDPDRSRPSSLPTQGPVTSGSMDAADLRRALAVGEIVVVYQPQVSLVDGRVVSVESLVRWHHCDHGLLLPEVFLPMAEASGVVRELGRHVLHTACLQAAAWAADAARAGRPAPVVAVNVSRTELADPDLPGRVSLALETAGLDPTLLRIEVAEAMLPHRPVPVGRPLARLRELGVELSVDGLDMVSSGTDALVDLPVEELKLGPDAVRHHGRHGWRPVAGVEELAAAARSRGMRVLAAGVESGGHAGVLAGLGVAVAQGRWFAPPQSAEASSRLLDADVRFRRHHGSHAAHPRPRPVRIRSH